MIASMICPTLTFANPDNDVSSELQVMESAGTEPSEVSVGQSEEQNDNPSTEQDSFHDQNAENEFENPQDESRGKEFDSIKQDIDLADNECAVTVGVPEDQALPKDFKIVIKKELEGTGAEVQPLDLTLASPVSEDQQGDMPDASTAGADVEETTVTQLDDNFQQVYILEAGIYCILIDNDGYYKTKQPFLVTAEDVAAKKMSVIAEPQKMAGNGCEPTNWIFRWNPEVEEAFYNSDDITGIIEFDTPSFKESKAAHQFASSSERIEYVTEQVSKSDWLYMYFLDEKTPVVFFTTSDLSAAETYEEAAKIIAKSSKLKIGYQAQIHGNEPAGGEAAMYLISQLAGEYGDQIADQVDMYIVPCVNPEGTDAFVREGTGGFDMNRDGLQVRSDKVKYLHKLFTTVMPQVTIDGHESHFEDTVSKTGIISHLDDVRIRGVDNNNTIKAIRDLSHTLASKSIKANQNVGLRPFYYTSTVNSTASRGYYGMYDTVSTIVESVGLLGGKDHFQRRVFAQYVSVKGIIDGAVSNKTAIIKEVQSARSGSTSAGKTYSKKKTYILKQAYTTAISMVRPSMSMTGEMINEKKTDTSAKFGVIKKTRPYPTAYIFSKKAKNATFVANALKANGVKVKELPPGSKIKLIRYGGSRTTAKLKKAKIASFPHGAYMISMNQVGRKMIATSLEPDVYDNNKSNLKETLSYKMSISSLYRFTKNYPDTKINKYISKSTQKISANIKSKQTFKLSQRTFVVKAKSAYGTPKYSSNKKSVVSINSKTGEAQILKKGKVVITVTVPAIYKYKKATRKFKVTIK